MNETLQLHQGQDHLIIFAAEDGAIDGSNASPFRRIRKPPCPEEVMPRYPADHLRPLRRAPELQAARHSEDRVAVLGDFADHVPRYRVARGRSTTPPFLS